MGEAPDLPVEFFTPRREKAPGAEADEIQHRRGPWAGPLLKILVLRFRRTQKGTSSAALSSSRALASTASSSGDKGAAESLGGPA